MTTDANNADNFSLAAIQMVSTPSVEKNCATARRLVADAARAGAHIILLPEYWPIMGMAESDKIAVAEECDSGPIQDCMATMAREHGIWLIGGTMPMQTTDVGKIRNTTLVYNPAGEQVVRYDKIHLFSFTQGDEAFDEARTIARGTDIITFDAPCGKVGLSVCYDLRFPELYRAMGNCSLIVVPSAFTWTTGQAHWEILLRARAIENQCYVLAAAQGGRHENGRRTWGHSMLIDPWGEIKAVLPEGEGVVAGILEPIVMEGIRVRLPALQHRTL